ncbi:MAG: hypothetical protein PUI41_02625 [Lachnospiraceae bacterium]|nr:hypothetical protein [Lachnospiraceae bacterium]MDY4096979.1 hypothetical protein [Lachnospiraceae bacterium]
MVLGDAAARRKNPAAGNVVKMAVGKITGAVTMVTEGIPIGVALTEIIPAAVTDRRWGLHAHRLRQCPETNFLTWKMNPVPVDVKSNKVEGRSFFQPGICDGTHNPEITMLQKQQNKRKYPIKKPVFAGFFNLLQIK